ncbi:hypothetical protein U1Q18_020279 [Sarracenia purpurea var. burkii]
MDAKRQLSLFPNNPNGATTATDDTLVISKPTPFIPEFRLMDKASDVESWEESQVSHRYQGEGSGPSGTWEGPSGAVPREGEGVLANTSRDATIAAYLGLSSDDAEAEMAKYWDKGYKAFKIQDQAMWPHMDFTLIQPNEIDETQIEGGGGSAASGRDDSVV